MPIAVDKKGGVASEKYKFQKLTSIHGADLGIYKDALDFVLVHTGTLPNVLWHPIYAQTAVGGHFGRDELPWEKTDKIALLRDSVL